MDNKLWSLSFQKLPKCSCTQISSMITVIWKSRFWFHNVISTHFSTLSSVVALGAFPAVGKFVIYHPGSIVYLRNTQKGGNDFSWSNSKTLKNSSNTKKRRSEQF